MSKAKVKTIYESEKYNKNSTYFDLDNLHSCSYLVLNVSNEIAVKDSFQTQSDASEAANLWQNTFPEESYVVVHVIESTQTVEVSKVLPINVKLGSS